MSISDNEIDLGSERMQMLFNYYSKSVLSEKLHNDVQSQKKFHGGSWVN